MLLGVRVKKGKSKARAAVLRTHAPHGFEGVESMQYFGSHPVSKYKIGEEFYYCGFISIYFKMPNFILEKVTSTERQECFLMPCNRD